MELGDGEGAAEVVGIGEVDDDELGQPGWLSLPDGGGLLGEIVATGTPLGLSSAAPLIVPELASSAPAAQISTITTTAVPTVAMALRRRYTDGGRGPSDSSTSGK